MKKLISMFICLVTLAFAAVVFATTLQEATKLDTQSPNTTQWTIVTNTWVTFASYIAVGPGKFVSSGSVECVTSGTLLGPNTYLGGAQIRILDNGVQVGTTSWIVGCGDASDTKIGAFYVGAAITDSNVHTFNIQGSSNGLSYYNSVTKTNYVGTAAFRGVTLRSTYETEP